MSDTQTRPLERWTPPSWDSGETPVRYPVQDFMTHDVGRVVKMGCSPGPRSVTSTWRGEAREGARGRDAHVRRRRRRRYKVTRLRFGAHSGRCLCSRGEARGKVDYSQRSCCSGEAILPSLSVPFSLALPAF